MTEKIEGIKILSKNDIIGSHMNMSVGSLRKFLDENKDLKDDVAVVIERVEDRYFEKNNWGGIFS